MVASRRAAMRGASPSLVTGVRAALTVISLALAGVLSALAFASVHMARRVVTPASRVPDTRILALDTAAQTITLSQTPDTRAARALRPLHERHRELHQARLGPLARTTRRSSASCSPTSPSDAQLSPDAAFSGWYYDRADELHLPYTPELIGSAVGPCPAWLFPAGSGDVWVIQVHGRGTTRAECLRAVPVFHALGHHVARRLVPQRRRGAAQPRRHLHARRDRVARRRRGGRIRPPTGREAHPAHGLVDGRRDRAAAVAQLGASRRHRGTHPRVARHRLAHRARVSGAGACGFRPR